MNTQETGFFIQKQWTCDSNCPVGRSGHVACKLPDCMLLWGGASNTYPMIPGDEDTHMNEFHFIDPSKVSLYYPVLDKWVEKSCLGVTTIPLSGSSAVVFDNAIWILFGFSQKGNLNSMYKLDLTDFKFHNVNYLHHNQPSKLPSPRNKHSSWHFNKKIYSFGGYGDMRNEFLNEYINYVEDFTTPFSFAAWNDQLLEFDPVSSTWKAIFCKGKIPLARAAYSMAQVGSKVMVFGGRHRSERLNDLQQLDMYTFTWTRIDTNVAGPLGRSWHTLNYLSHDNSLIVLGGYSTSQSALDDAWKFDLKTSTWQNITQKKKTARLWHTSVVMDDELLVFGGCNNDILSEYSKYVPGLSTFRTKPQNLYRLALKVLFDYRHLYRPCDLLSYPLSITTT